MTRAHLRTIGAALLVVVGIACIAYAISELRSPAQPAAPLQPPVESPKDDAAVKTPVARQSGGRQADGKKPDAKVVGTLARNALAVTVLLILVVVVALVALRRFRPAGLHRRAPPSDTTDLWKEAGKRLK